MRMVALVQTQVLMAIPVPNMENRLIFSTIRLGRFLMVHSGMGLFVWEAIVTLASHLLKIRQRRLVCVSNSAHSVCLPHLLASHMTEVHSNAGLLHVRVGREWFTFLRQNSFQSSQCQHGGERGLHSLLHAEWLDGGLECASGCGYLCVTGCGGWNWEVLRYKAAFEASRCKL